jgi:REP element-mobilizing transposase RayT
MTAKYDPQRHHRKSIRLPGYDYSSAGAYFVTVVTWGRDCLFGDVVDGVMVLNDIGKIVQEEWERTAIVRQNIELGAYVVMPNHFHGILIIHDGVGASRRLAPTTMNAISPKPGSLGAIMAQFKSIVTKRIWKIDETVNGIPIWQRNYHEHIIRNEREMGAISRYIEANPVMWADDEENPRNNLPAT